MVFCYIDSMCMTSFKPDRCHVFEIVILALCMHMAKVYGKGVAQLPVYPKTCCVLLLTMHDYELHASASVSTALL